MTTNTSNQEAQKTYVLNQETQKIELRFTKQEYQTLSDADKKELKRAFMFAPSRSAWVSRSTSNHYSAIRTAEKLGFTNAGKTGERLSYAEEVERKAERAADRAWRYEHRAEKAVERAEALQADWNEARQDWSFVTQPNINSSKGRSFTNHRNRLIERYEKGFDEYRKSSYFRERALTAEQTANMTQYKDRVYLNNRIEECNKEIRHLERKAVQAEEKENQEWLSRLLERMEYELDKLAFLHNKLDEIGGIEYSKGNIKPGYHVKIRGTWDEVIKANPKTVLTRVVEGGAAGFIMTHPYAEIQEMKIPEEWQEPKPEQAENPFNIGDIVVQIFHRGSNYENMVRAFQIVKVTNKSVNIQQINIENGHPVKDNFKSNETLQRRIGKDRSGEYVVNYDNYYLFLYNE